MLAAYASSKAGIVQLTRALATAWAKDNIQVNAVLPGFIDTEITRQGRVQVRGLQERIEQHTPAGVGANRKTWRASGIPGSARVKLHHWHSHSRRWRLPGDDVKGDRF